MYPLVCLPQKQLSVVPSFGCQSANKRMTNINLSGQMNTESGLAPFTYNIQGYKTAPNINPW